jgi:hypothetical protein
VETYLILRRDGWRAVEELRDADARSTIASERMAEDVAWIRSYVIEECDGGFGTICVYRASSPEAIRSHARQAALPVDEIVRVAHTVVVRDDPVATVT